MKKIVFALVFLFSIGAFAQTDDVYTQNVKKAIELYKGMQTLDGIAQDVLTKLPQNKINNPDFQNALSDAKNRAYADAVTRFRDKFSGDEIKEIIKDLSVAKESYSGVTNNFTRQWGISQRKYIEEVNKIYKKFQ